jgi:predicted ATPase
MMKKLVLDEMPPHELLSRWRKHNITIVEVEQRMPDYEAIIARRNRNAAFESWRKQLSQGDTLPRGSYFIGKKPGVQKTVLMDEVWSIDR